jgi:predicted naringenin-chalcone synthase
MSLAPAAIVGLACAAPALSLAQERTLAIAMELSPAANEEERRQTEAIYRRAGVRARGAATPDGEGVPDPASLVHAGPEDAAGGRTTAQRMRDYGARVAPLARSASAGALRDAGIDGGSVTHLVTASCTGFGAPGWELGLVGHLGLAGSVQRTHIGFMGCHAALNALRVARAFVGADPAARVLVCCAEVCSIHFKRRARPDQVVANALFADGAGACVVAHGSGGYGRITSTSSSILPESAEQMAWSIGDHGFEMSLGMGLPGTVRRHAGGWIDRWLGAEGLDAGSMASWAVHPGGPRILDAFREGVGLPPGAMEASREVLAEHGNMSSPTVLFILERLRRTGRLAHPCVMVSFGPGVTAEGLLLTDG